MRYIAAIRQIVRQKLRDEIVVSVTPEWEDDEIDVHIQQILEEISAHVPYETKETLTTVAATRDISLATVTDLMSVERVEYPVGGDPRGFIPFTTWGTTLTLGGDTKPSIAESAYAYCRKLHAVTNSSSTLGANLEQLLIRGTCASLAAAKAREHINEVNQGGGNVASQMLQWAMNELSIFRADIKKMARQRQANSDQF